MPSFSVFLSSVPFFGIQFKTQDVIIMFENYCEKSLTSGNGGILTIVDKSISAGFFQLTMYPKTSFKLVLIWHLLNIPSVYGWLSSNSLRIFFIPQKIEREITSIKLQSYTQSGPHCPSCKCQWLSRLQLMPRMTGRL